MIALTKVINICQNQVGFDKQILTYVYVCLLPSVCLLPYN